MAVVLAEFDRIGWPVPAAVEVLATRRGSRGGLTGRLRLVFSTAQKGPLAIGRTAHKGSGLLRLPDNVSIGPSQLDTLGEGGYR